ncbi:MAG: recombinase family protein [Candidatus Kapabacteria bacterium]|nr:recombinase family protein [Candidatus Kapabacteria bacterium]
MNNKNKVVSYLRCSTQEQNNEKNIAEILRFANDKKLGNVEFIEEKISGSVHWKDRKIFNVVQELQAGDCLIISEISRISRRSYEIFEILSILLNKQIVVYSIKENWQLDDSLQSQIMAFAFGLSATIEKKLLQERTREALRARKAAGVKLGRKPGTGSSKLDKYRVEIESMIKNGVTKQFIAKKYGISGQGVYNWCKKNIKE